MRDGVLRSSRTGHLRHTLRRLDVRVSRGGILVAAMEDLAAAQQLCQSPDSEGTREARLGNPSCFCSRDRLADV